MKITKKFIAICFFDHALILNSSLGENIMKNNITNTIQKTTGTKQTAIPN